uniref:Uncharacterized protein n=1 Tax=Anopheles quadriannulatus TaxID=34691 RepID=A0A182XSR6_ANOQN
IFLLELLTIKKLVRFSCLPFPAVSVSCLFRAALRCLSHRSVRKSHQSGPPRGL